MTLVLAPRRGRLATGCRAYLDAARRDEVGTNTSRIRSGVSASVTTGTRECPWGRLLDLVVRRTLRRRARASVSLRVCLALTGEPLPRAAPFGRRFRAAGGAGATVNRCPIEVIGDSARGEAYAAARLVVDGDRIVGRGRPGMARSLGGSRSSRPAAVPGETLAADAVANAIAEVFRAEPTAGRIAVAMSGGVDSAVALLRATTGRDRRHASALARPRRARHRARLLLPGRRHPSASNVSCARAAARHARPP